MSDDCWLRDENCMALHGPAPSNLRTFRVRDLILSDRKSWNQDLLRDFLLPAQCDAVLRVPLYSSISHDTRTWWPTKNGIYSVKSAYHIFLEKLTVPGL